LAGQLQHFWEVNRRCNVDCLGIERNLASLPALFLKIFAWGAVGAVVMLLLTPRLKRLMGGASR
jgi:hypothetical protein